MRWRSALTTVGKLAGWPLRDGSEVEFITAIVNEIWKQLNHTQYLSSVDGEIVGIDSRVKEIYKLLRLDIFDEIRFVGIWGMGGIGKTTIARVVCEKLSDRYEGSCFLANVRENSEKKGIESLQEMLLRKVLMKNDLNIGDYHEGISLIRKRLCRKRILLVLDDVNQLEQLERLAGRKDWFGSGSRIIITTRDKHVLTSHEINNIYMVKELDDNEAHKLFCLKAFKCMGPTNDLDKLSKRVVHYANGLPLALDVLGKFLCGRSVTEWKSALKRLKVDPDPEITKILRISYDGLGKMEKKIFLDIACFFKGGDVDQIKEILDRCDFHLDIGIPILVERSLIRIEDNKLQMHDMVQEMGRKVVCEQDPDEPGKWSRLWLCQDIHRVLARNMGSSAVEAMITVDHNKDITHANGRCFSTMSNLRLLGISNVHISEDLEYLSNELRILKWQGYPLKTLPSNFNPQNLFRLSLCYSRIEYLWNGIKSFGKLKTIKMNYSRNLVRTPDFTMIPNLERLDLQYCTRLLEVHQSLGFLKRLVILNLNNCENLVQFPSDVCGLKSLQILNLHGCSKLNRLPLNLEEMEHLEDLDLAGTAIRQVPSVMAQLRNLRTLSFHGCKGGPPETWSSYLFSRLLPTRKPDCMGLLLPPLAGLFSLRRLDLSDCNLSEGALPIDVGSLKSLTDLDISGNNFVSLPDTISQLSELEIFNLHKCHKLQSLPKLPPGLGFVEAEECTSLKTISSVLELTSLHIGLHLFNCFNLVETRGGNNNNLAIMLLKRWLQMVEMSNHDPISQERPRRSHFLVHLPGSKIPNLFNCQSEGCEISIGMPNGWLNGEFLGFVVSVVFSAPDHSDGFDFLCRISTTYGSCPFVLDYSDFLTIKSDNFCLGYFSRHQLDCPADRFNGVPFNGARFSVSGQTEPLVKRCGIRPLYKQDVEYLEDLSATDVGISILSIDDDDSENRYGDDDEQFSGGSEDSNANSRGTAAGTNSVADQSHDD